MVLKSWSTKKVESKGETLQNLCNLGLWEQIVGWTIIPAEAWSKHKRHHEGQRGAVHMIIHGFHESCWWIGPTPVVPSNGFKTITLEFVTLRHSNTFSWKFLVSFLNIVSHTLAVFLGTLWTPITLLVSLFLLFLEAELLTGPRCRPREGRINWSRSEPCHLCGAAGLNWSYYQRHPAKAPAPHPWPLTFPWPCYRGNS